MVTPAWETVSLQVDDTTTVAQLKREALRAALKRAPLGEQEYIVKFRGAAVLDESVMRGPSAPSRNAPFIVLPSRRPTRAVSTPAFTRAVTIFGRRVFWRSTRCYSRSSTVLSGPPCAQVAALLVVVGVAPLTAGPWRTWPPARKEMKARSGIDSRAAAHQTARTKCRL